MGTLAVLIAVVKVGIIGCDTSHALAFTKVMNIDKPDFARDFRVTAAHKWGSKDIVSSTNRYEKYIAQLRDMGVEMCETVDDLLSKVDVVCLETNDGREHLWQAEKCFKAKKRVFIDKPIAQDYPHAKAIYDLGRKHGAMYFSTSALRYADVHQDCRNGKCGAITGCEYFAPSPIEEQGTHSRYVWYGIHGFEPVLTVMGRGVDSVCVVTAEDTDVVVMKWKDGRIATLRANKKSWQYGGFAFPAKGKPVALGGYEGYEKLLKRICAFFATGEIPVPNEETLEIFAVMDAAAKSAAENGREVRLVEITGCAPSPRAIASVTVEGQAPSLLPEGKKFRLVWHDEFEGTRLDTSKWCYRTNFWGKRAKWYAAPEDHAVEVRDGLVHLKVVRLPNGQYVSPQLQTGGLLWDMPRRKTDNIDIWPLSKRQKPLFEHRYGYYECRFRLQRKDGWWSAFWMQSESNGTTLDPGRSGIEQDIMESFKPGEVIGHAFHYNGYGADYQFFSTPRGKKPSSKEAVVRLGTDDFHTIGLLWEPDGYRVYVDGVLHGEKVGMVGNEAVSHVPEFLLLTTECKNFREEGKPDAAIEEAWRSGDDFVADFVRVYDVLD